MLPHFRRRKKKLKGFILPPSHLNGSFAQIEVNEEVVSEIKIESNKTTEDSVENKIPSQAEAFKQVKTNEIKVSAFSLAGLKAKKALETSIKSQVKKLDEFPKEHFNETDMLIQWNKFAQKLEDRGQKILHTLMLINDPVLENTTIYHELPNNSTKEEFERALPEILGYLRGMLHNHDISIEIKVNETISNKRAFTPVEKFNRLNEINPNLKLLKKTFDLDF